MSPSWTSVPLELWDAIRSYTPPLSRHLVSTILRSRYALEEKHSQVWGSIFKDDTWLNAVVDKGYNPVLIGHDLHKLYNCQDHKFRKNKSKNAKPKNTKPIYLVLVIGHAGDGAQLYGVENLSKNFLATLREQPNYLHRTEFELPESGIILSPGSIFVGQEEETVVSEPRRLVSRKNGQWTSAYLYWKDPDFALRTIGPENIVGIINKNSTKQDVSRIVAFTWEHLPEKTTRQHIFTQVVTFKKVDRIYKETESDSRVVGWAWKPKWETSEQQPGGWWLYRSNIKGKKRENGRRWGIKG